MATDRDETEEPSAPEPRANPDLLGHEAVEAALLRAVADGKLPHALLLGGPRGIGKATLAFRFARFLFAQRGGGEGLFGAPPPSGGLAVAESDPVFRRVAASGHADLLTVERAWDEKRRRLRGEIIAAHARAIPGFLRLTPAEDGWRVVIVDGADEMNRESANALLKVLEEPPRRALLLLVSHNPGRLLPTIRSRCRKLTMKALPEPVIETLLRRYRPELEAADRAALARLAQGSIGRALELAASGGLGLYQELTTLLGSLPELDVVALHTLADRIARAEAEEAYRTVTDLLSAWLPRLVTGAASGEIAEIMPGEGALMARLAGRRGLDRWMEVWDNVTRLFAQADGLNLDRKQVVLTVFHALERAARAGQPG
jgi:DNA polymerase-3 subunit delta'